MKAIQDVSSIVDRNLHPIIMDFKSLLNWTRSRQFLIMLIFLLEVFSLCLSGFSIFLTIIFFSDSESSGWFTWLGLSIVGLGLVSICIVGLHGAYTVNLGLLLAYFWGIAVFIAPIILGVIACLDYVTFVGVWFSHSWSETNFAFVRKLFCPDGTGQTLCAAPIDGGPAFPDIDGWCTALYNSTACQGIRDDAVSYAVEYGTNLASIQAFVSTGILGIIVLTIGICFRILSATVITESMNDVINYILLVPIGGCIGVITGLRSWETYDGQYSFEWFHKLYIAVAVAIFVSIPIGIIAGKLKNKNMMIGYMLIIVLTITALSVGGSFLTIYSSLMKSDYTPTDEEADTIACAKNLSCCCCDTLIPIDGRLCPEWSIMDIKSIMLLELNIYSAISYLSLGYLVGAFIVALYVWRTIKDYKSDYV